ncbi:MAG TPA: hypothetical protein VF755_00395, partial [Catenuloplanes sp.]
MNRPSAVAPAPVDGAGTVDPRPRGQATPALSARTAVHRLVIAGLSLGFLLIGGAALGAGLEGVRTLALLGFCLLGVGSAPWQLSAGVRLWPR